MNLKEKLKKITDEWVQATGETFANHPTANFFKTDFKEEINALVNNFDASYKVNASVGKGGWANVPWLSILNPKITTTTEDGIYPVYIFNADGSGFYLSLIQGIGGSKVITKKAQVRAEKIKTILLGKIPQLLIWGTKEIDLKPNSSRAKSYEKVNISAKFYDAHNIPESHVLIADLQELLNFYRQIESIDITQELQLLETSDQEISKDPLYVSLHLAPLSKPFLLLAGISGTGKSRFVREQAKASGSLCETYCLISVRPDWHEPSDLLGYTSRLTGVAEYVSTDVLKFIVKAWKEIIQSIVFGTKGTPDDWRGKPLENIRPYWLCLDEMNLAPVEQYFADYLSVLETRCWNDPKKLKGSGFDYVYECDPLIKGDVFRALDNGIVEGEKKPSDKLANDLNLDLSIPLERNIWQYFLEHGIAIPFNLIVAGTVNMDETTHGFSRKVIDRALSFDFGEFYPNDFADYFSATKKNKTLSYPIFSSVKADDLPAADPDGQKSIAFLGAVNQVLDNTSFKLAFRALNELLLAVVSMDPQNDTELHAVWDDFLMCKVLPRIEGDCDKLASGDPQKPLLNQLAVLLEAELSSCWKALEGAVAARPDLYREHATGDDKVIRIACRSKAKIEWMEKRLTNSGFTSFWP